MVVTRNVLTVFMASPGDVGEERSELARVVYAINKRLAADLGWHIELRGWENTVPGMGRPQSRINPDVQACDVFIGILWKRWGTPTGEFSSGFREEFEIAYERRSKSTDPEILMYFRAVEPTFAADPGEQYRQVLAFKDKLTSSRTLLYQGYSDVQNFASQVEDHLTSLILKRAQADGRTLHATGGAGRKQPEEGVHELPSLDTSEPIALQVILGNPSLSGEVTLARWDAARRMRDVALAPCALGNGRFWALDPFDPGYGLSLIVGSTGSGKSNAILAMAFALAFSLPPEYLRFSILDLDSFQSVRVLEDLGATVLPLSPHGELDLEAVLKEAKRREQRLKALGYQSVRSLWRRDPGLREEFPAWVICADEAYKFVHDDTTFEKVLAAAGRVAGLGIHIILGSQRMGELGNLALATRAKRIALQMHAEQDFIDFTGTHNPFQRTSSSAPGLAVCAEGEKLESVRFAHVDDRELADAFESAADRWKETRMGNPDAK
ncbi:FtsK/SpoIIIE family protein [Leucobacter komagatae]|uniref:FtsK/SpoIIIE family protein n=1 Tax=Leucobacter komagatae TaxID=55969 RepID=A0A542Y9L3_9MICO|nr:FtsK/SpoIIIE domain-containing protein [Leucobacter komagatae]TQL44780.1 FtsK/SpoIIIE family protein [Leucobacter komagatae]